MFRLFITLWLCLSSTCHADESSLLHVPTTYKDYTAFYNALIQEDAFFTLNDGDKNKLFKLATDSTTDIISLGNKPHQFAYILRTNYYEGGNTVRGASGNGDYYILMPTKAGLTLIGRFWGNGYSIETLNGIPRIGPTARGAKENPFEWLIWNGNIFTKEK